MITLTDQMARGFLAEVVEGNETRYADCYYTAEGRDIVKENRYSSTRVDEAPAQITPECIVGQVLFRAGLPGEALFKLDIEEVGTIVAPMFREIVEDAGLKFEKEALITLTIAQRVQDTGSSWGEALRAIDESHMRQVFEEVVDWALTG